MPKATTPSRSTGRRHNPLADDILSTSQVRTTTKPGKKRSHKSANNDDDDDPENGRKEGFIDAKASRKILQIGQDLAEEEAAEQQKILDEAGAGEQHNKAFDFSTRFGDEGDYISDDEEKFEEGDWEDEDLDRGVCCPLTCTSSGKRLTECRRSTQLIWTCLINSSRPATKIPFSTRAKKARKALGLI
jgi:essential nuclear protein 1